MDASAGGPLAGESPAETKRLAEMTRLARELLAASGLFEIVDVAATKDEMVETHWLRKCNGCDADVARGLGAELSFVGFFRKVSVTEQSLVFHIRDTKSGALVDISQSDLGGETDKSWRRALGRASGPSHCASTIRNSILGRSPTSMSRRSSM